jgi:hypothetical protein
LEVPLVDDPGLKWTPMVTGRRLKASWTDSIWAADLASLWNVRFRQGQICRRDEDIPVSSQESRSLKHNPRGA